MDVPEPIIQAAAMAADVGADDIRAILTEGERKIYRAGEYLFHESMPRRWVGIIEDGEVELLRGLHGSATVIAVLGKGREPIHLYFGARDEGDIYLEQHFQDLGGDCPGLRFIPVLSEPAGPTSRRTGTVVDAVAADFQSFAGVKAYLAGPPAMVEAGVRLLRAHGVAAADIHADPFYPMPSTVPSVSPLPSDTAG